MTRFTLTFIFLFVISACNKDDTSGSNVVNGLSDYCSPKVVELDLNKQMMAELMEKMVISLNRQNINEVYCGKLGCKSYDLTSEVGRGNYKETIRNELSSYLETCESLMNKSSLRCNYNLTLKDSSGNEAQTVITVLKEDLEMYCDVALDKNKEADEL